MNPSLDIFSPSYERLKWLRAFFLVLFLCMIEPGEAREPLIFAHRGGPQEAPENTLYAFEKAVQAGIDGLEIDLQITQDHAVVLYHPTDLSVWTNGKGPVHTRSYAEIKALDAAFFFDPQKNNSYPERGKGHRVPLFSDILATFSQRPLIIDLKSPLMDPFIEAVLKVVEQQKAFDRVIFYSTQAGHLQLLRQKEPRARLFESRDKTRERLLIFKNSQTCSVPDKEAHFIGFEWEREMRVEEKLSLGDAHTNILFRLWDPAMIACVHEQTASDSKIFLFGVNSLETYKEIEKVGGDAIFSDRPAGLIQDIHSLPISG